LFALSCEQWCDWHANAVTGISEHLWKITDLGVVPPAMGAEMTGLFSTHASAT
jgi:hypothetical protein